MQHLEPVGFLTIAQNNSEVDYLKLAYLQALTIKRTMPNSRYCVLVDKKTYLYVCEKHLKVFDHVRIIDDDRSEKESWKLGNEWQAFYLTPFKETIKLESDIVFTRSIEHWLNAFRLRDIVLSYGCKDYRERPGNSSQYRSVFETNDLPDVYNGLMYFRYSQTASNFFNMARIVYENWETVRSELKGLGNQQATTDVVYAIVAKTLGVEQCTIPTLDYINFNHLKPEMNQWLEHEWSQDLLTEFDDNMIRINNVNQYHPVHYYDKTWCTDETIERYEHELL
jgi:hypothetical protein